MVGRFRDRIADLGPRVRARGPAESLATVATLGDSGDISAISTQSVATVAASPPLRGSLHAYARESALAWDAEEWQSFFDERAGIAEYDGGLPRPEAERSAYQSCLAEWEDQNPVQSSSDRCCVCGKQEGRDTALLAIGLNPNQVWLHDVCWKIWREDRLKQAKACLDRLGIQDPARMG